MTTRMLTETEEEVLVSEETTQELSIVVFNDDVNTFDHVIESLVEVCDHEPLQAEQCAHIIHFRGKCSVKRGEYLDLEPRCVALLERGLTAEIQ